MNLVWKRICRLARVQIRGASTCAPIALATFGFLASPPTAVAQEQATPGNPESGQELFERHCATCHGIDAEGGGPMAPILMVQPSNLTTLTQRYDGFPVTHIVRRIDGRDPLLAHGSRMPVWGDFFEGEDAALKAETGQPILTSQPIVDLAAYLETIQQ